MDTFAQIPSLQQPAAAGDEWGETSTEVSDCVSGRASAWVRETLEWVRDSHYSFMKYLIHSSST